MISARCHRPRAVAPNLVKDRRGMNTTHVSLLERLRQPAPHEAWDRFVRLYTPLLYQWARRLGLPAQDAADFVQDVFTLLLRKLPSFAYDRHKRFRGWLWTVTLNHWRATRRRRRPVSPGAGDEALAELPAPGGPVAFEDAEYRDYLVGRALRAMRAEFHPATWRAFWECAAEDRPAAEVAARLGISVAAVYAAKSRVLRRLRQELDGLLD
jgi:RNA polymerase sigma-70 factor, ECF subfamily